MSDDHRYNHARLSVTIDGRDGGYTAELEEFVQEQPQLNLEKWDVKFPIVHQLQRLQRVSTEGSKWKRLQTALTDYVDTAGDVLGWLTNIKTQKPAFKLKGHQQLQREVQQLQDARKTVYQLHDPFTIGNRKTVTGLYEKLNHELRSTQLRQPRTISTSGPVPRPADVIAELSELIQEREDKIEQERHEKQQANIKEAVSKMQEAFTRPGTKAIKQLMGKLGVSLQTGVTGAVVRDKIRGLQAQIESNGEHAVVVTCTNLIDVGEVLVSLSRDNTNGRSKNKPLTDPTTI
eukprot:2223211-Rhodomonas_salina.1